MNRIKLIVVIAVFMLAGKANAEEMAKSFYYEYEKGYELVLLPDECTDSQLTEHPE